MKVGDKIKIIWHDKLKEVVIVGFKDGIPQVENANNNTKPNSGQEKLPPRSS